MTSIWAMGTLTDATVQATSIVPPPAGRIDRLPAGCPATENSISGPTVTKVLPARTASIQCSYVKSRSPSWA